MTFNRYLCDALGFDTFGMYGCSKTLKSVIIDGTKVYYVRDTTKEEYEDCKEFQEKIAQIMKEKRMGGVPRLTQRELYRDYMFSMNDLIFD